MTARLAGKVAIVTGAGSGIGQATAGAFAAEGAKVLCADIHDGAARETAGSIGPQAQSYAVDVTQPEAFVYGVHPAS